MRPWQESCRPCQLCGSHEDLYAEEVADWDTGLPVVRIGCLFDDAMDRLFPDEWRTEFLPMADAIREWNELFGLP